MTVDRWAIRCLLYGTAPYIIKPSDKTTGLIGIKQLNFWVKLNNFWVKANGLITEVDHKDMSNHKLFCEMLVDIEA